MHTREDLKLANKKEAEKKTLLRTFSSKMKEEEKKGGSEGILVCFGWKLFLSLKGLFLTRRDKANLPLNENKLLYIMAKVKMSLRIRGFEVESHIFGSSGMYKTLVMTILLPGAERRHGTPFEN